MPNPSSRLVVSHSLLILAGLLVLPLVTARVSGAEPATLTTTIICPADTLAKVKLAAREVRRYVYLRTGELLPIAQSATGNAITFKIDPTLEEQQYRLKSDGSSLSISGGSDVAVLYGTYHFAEKLGFRFQVDGDVIPDGKVAFSVPILDEAHEPSFKLRGIQPFHNFPEGPDWWNADDYKAYVCQLVKMRMNFIGFHTYPLFKPWTHVPPEPAVWIGLPEDADANGKVKHSYPTSWANTARNAWGYVPMKTSRFSFGAADLYESDDFGADVMKGVMPIPDTVESWNGLFNGVGALWKNVFGFAHELGVKSAIGIETPMIIPDTVIERLKAKGKVPEASIQELYEGVFRRIESAHSLDYFWFWTPERELNREQAQADLLAAVAAHEKVAPSFKLAACGWGWISHNFDHFNKVMPQHMAFSCINDEVGFAPVTKAFADLGGRPRWCIPWMEDDTALSTPQLWAGRIRKDAADARAYGCDGLMGIHWRTRVLSPNFSMLAEAGWNAPPSPMELRDIKRTPDWIAHRSFASRQTRELAFYTRWCASQFGHDVSADAAAVFADMDGNLPREHVRWINDSIGGSPGCVGAPDSRPWETVKEEYAFVDQLASLRPRVKGAGSLDRFDYWINQLSFFRGMGEVCCAMGEQDRRMEDLAKAGSNRDALQAALQARRRLLDAWSRMSTHLLQAVNTPGELGTVANLEQHSLHGHNLLTRHDAVLEKALGGNLPAEYAPSAAYGGKDRLIVPTVRSVVKRGDTINLKILAQFRQPAKSVVAKVRALGGGEWKIIAAKHVARGVWNVLLPRATDDFEYQVVSEASGGAKLLWPATAPENNLTVVVME